MRSTRSARTHAFTLLEILIAMAAFAIVLGAINSVFYAALRLRNKAADSFEKVLPLQNTMAVMKRDLANLVLPGGTLSGSLQTTPTSNLNQNTNGMSASATFVPGQVSPNFYTTGGTIDDTSPFSEMQRVSYVLRAPTNYSQGQDLFRSVTRNLLSTTSEQPVQQPLLTGVRTLAFLYYDGSQWREAWDSTVADLKTGLTNVLPSAIKVQITLASQVNPTGRGLVNPIEMVVPIVVQARTNLIDTTATSDGGGT